ncbi:MAG TPA: tetratricopeptide repeat protein [Candidatus Tectomicrobia bacterium]|nr:tetratricopeptide repeat protein [Candidatus Tectomicrobia bacterium]
MAYADAKGLPVSTRSADALAAHERGVDLFLRWRTGALDALEAAAQHDREFLLAHCTRAYVAWRMGRVDVARDAAEQVVARADAARDERERAHAEVVAAMRRDDHAAAHERLEAVAARYPTDRMAVRIVGLNCITRGDYRHGIDVARRSLEADPDEPQFQTMLGFFLEQSGYNDEGLAMSLRALARDPTNLYTYHAVGHAYLARGDYGRAVETFERATSLDRYPHLLWHLAETHAILGNTRLTRDYWASTTPPLPLHERIELLWRLEVLRHAPVDGAVWRDLAAQADRLLLHAEFQTVWSHHWMGVAFARAGQWDKAHAQVERLRRLPPGRAGGYWATLGVALLEGELRLVGGDEAGALALMAPAAAEVDTLGGGSREQKDIFRDVVMELHRRLGHVEEVVALAQERLLVNPHHVQSLAALAWAYERKGEAEVLRSTP